MSVRDARMGTFKKSKPGEPCRTKRFFGNTFCLLPNLQAMDLEGLLKVRIVGGYLGRWLRLQVKGFKKAPVLDFASVSRVVGDAIKGRIVDYPRSTLRQQPWRG